MSPIVVYDACVLYPAPLRDFLMRLALTGVIRPRWTEAIHEEWIRSVLKNRPDLTREQLDRTRTLMNSHVLDALVEGYEPLVDGLSLPDPDDRHVLAATIHASAEVLVTFNLADFPAATLAANNIQARHPDDFVCQLLRDAPVQVRAAAKRQRESLKNPPRSVDEYLETLERVGMPRTAAALRAFPEHL